MEKINIGVISASDFVTAPSLPYFFKIVNELEGIRLTLINPDFYVGNENDGLLEKELKGKIDVLYPRILPVFDEDRMKGKVSAYKKIAEMLGVPVTIDPDLLWDEFDKYKQIEILKAAGLEGLSPKTIFVQGIEEAKIAANQFGYPVVVKEKYGFQGTGVFLAQDEEELGFNIKENSQYLVQEFIKLEEVVDYRVYCIDNRVVGGLLRRSTDVNEFRTNTYLGAKAEFFQPDETLAALALKTNSAFGNNISSVDFIKKDDRYYFMEINNSFDIKYDTIPEKREVALSVINYCKKIAQASN